MNLFLQTIKESLLKQKSDLLFKTTRDLDIDTDGDEADEVQANRLLEVANQLNIRNNDKIIRIDSALKRIDEDKYGLCQDCGDDIPEKRLLANNYFLTCVGCAENRETKKKGF